DIAVYRALFQLGDRAFDIPIVEIDLLGVHVVVRVLKLTVDGQPVECPEFKRFYDEGTKRMVLRPATLYDAAVELDPGARDAGRDDADASLLDRTPRVPILCHREHMYPVAVCRVCVVETNPNTKLLPSCQYQVTDGLKFATHKTSKRVKQAVRNLTELLMADHPTPCDKERRYPGSCELE